MQTVATSVMQGGKSLLVTVQQVAKHCLRTLLVCICALGEPNSQVTLICNTTPSRQALPWDSKSINQSINQSNAMLCGVFY